MSKNNQHEIIRKMEDQRQRFSLRKYGIGVASVLIGLTFMGGIRPQHMLRPNQVMVLEKIQQQMKPHQ